jgi:hypothetical protein
MVSRSVCLGVKFTLELVTRYFLSENCCVVSVGRPLWREVGSVSYCQCHQCLVHCQRFKIIYIVHVTCFKYMHCQYHSIYKVEVEVCPGVRRPSGTRDQFFFLLEISFRQLRLCYFVAPSLTRGRVCNLLVQLLLGLVRAVTLGSKSRRTHGHILLSHLRLPQPGGPGSCIYIPQEQGGPVIPPGTGFPFCRLLRLAGTTVDLF